MIGKTIWNILIAQRRLCILLAEYQPSQSIFSTKQAFLFHRKQKAYRANGLQKYELTKLSSHEQPEQPQPGAP